MSAARTARGELVRTSLLDAGLELFHSRGYHATGVQDITRTAGVPKGSFYNHFASKEDLAIAALRQYADQSPVTVLLDSERPPLDRIESHFAELEQRFTASGYRRGCMLGNFANEVVDGNDAVREQVGELFTAWVALLAVPIEQGQASGTFAAALEPEALAGIILSAWEGSLTRARASRSVEPLRGFAALLGQILGPPADATPHASRPSKGNSS